jgi:phosphoesterase RecJ-like protein
MLQPQSPSNPSAARPITQTSETTVPDRAAFDAVCRELRQGQRFLLTSHERPDGDSIGSQLALAFALDRLGKHSHIVNADPPPVAYRVFPGADRIEISREARGEFDAVVVLECGDLGRPGVAGLDRYRIVNIDHHLGNRMYGAVNYYDTTAAACTEVVVAFIDALGVPLTREIATHVYLGILTDTGSFHHSNVTPRTFDICRRVTEAGVDAAAMAQQIYHSASLGRVRLLGALLGQMRLEAHDRLAVLYFDDALLAALGATYDDTEGLINIPLTARTIHAVALLKGQDGSEQLRVSMRSKGNVDVRSIAQRFGGGGHFNAAGCSIPGPRAAAEATLVDALTRTLDEVPFVETGTPSP